MFGSLRFLLLPFIYTLLASANTRLAPVFGLEGQMVKPIFVWLLAGLVVFYSRFIFSRMIIPIIKRTIWLGVLTFVTSQVLNHFGIKPTNMIIGGTVAFWITAMIVSFLYKNIVSKYLRNKVSTNPLVMRFKRLFRVKKRNCAIDLSIQQIDAFGNGNAQLKGRLFEEFTAELYRTLGYNAQTTTSLRQEGRLPASIQKRGGSGEQGVDVIVESFSPKGERCITAIQCKHYSDKVGNKAVQEIVAALSLYGAQRGIVVTNQYFTKQAKELAMANGITLVDRDELQIYIERAVKNFARIQNAA